jgi:hypothetical protein
MAQLPNEREFGDFAQWPGRAVLDSAGDRLGDIREIYLDRDSGRPEWVLVDVEADEPRFVPLAGAAVEPEAIRVAHPADVVHGAPSIGPEAHIDPDHERRLYAHYGLDYSEDESGSGLPEETEPAEEATNLAPPPAEPPTAEELESADIPLPPTVRDEEETAPLWSEAASEEAPSPATDEPEPAVAAPGVPGPAISDAPETADESIPEIPAPGVPATEESAETSVAPLPPPEESVEPPPAVAPPEGAAAAPLPPSPPEAPPPVFTPPPPEPPRAAPPPPPYEPETAHLPVLGTRRRLGLAVGAAGLAAVLFLLIRRLR